MSGNKLDDKDIIELYWSRDPSAITVSAEQYGKYCHRIAWNILRNPEDCEECINETWFRAWKSMPDARPDCLAAFFGSITRRLSLDYYRKNRAAKRGGGEMPLIYDELQDCRTETAENVPLSRTVRAAQTELSHNNVEHHLDVMVLTEAINTFLSRLDSTSRILFVRRYWYADSVRDLAGSLHLSESRVKSNLFRTRKKLKKHLESEGIMI